MRSPSSSRLLSFLLCAALMWHGSARGESEERKKLRTGESETPEPLTDEPLKGTMQNLFLQEDVFPQRPLVLQIGQRIAVYDDDGARAFDGATNAEIGFFDSWTVGLRAPTTFFPGAQRGLGNFELGVLYSFWISPREYARLSATVNTILPTRSAAGTNAVAHDASLIAYLRLAPLHFQGVLTLDVSYGKDIDRAPQFRPEGALAAILKIESYEAVLELAAQRSFDDLRYLAALGAFWDPDGVELGLAARIDMTRWPLDVGGIALLSYAFSTHHAETHH